MKILLIIFFFSSTLCELSQECQKMFMSYKHPYVCCKYPMRKILKVHEENCESKCKNIVDKCCLIDCKYRETGVIVNKNFHDHAMLKLYENFLEENGAGKYSQWLSVVEKSIKQCMEKIPKTDKIYTCNVLEYVIDITDCINLMNYLNCPTFERTTQCEAARDFVKNLKKCGRDRNGTYLVNYQYWDFETIDPRRV